MVDHWNFCAVKGAYENFLYEENQLLQPEVGI